MKKVLFPILAVVLALSLAIPMAAAPAAANTTVEPVILYGTELGGSADKIYVIDVANGTATSVFTTNLDAHVNYANGNAFDVDNHRLYYSSSAKKLYFYDFDLGTQTLAGSINGVAACAAFYDGKYYYIVQGTDDLRAVSLDGDGKIASDDAVWLNFTASANKSFSFGDIVITAGGILYGSTPTPAEFFSIDLNTPTYTQVSTSGAVGLQLAYGCDGVLYGHSAGSGDFYVVDPSVGSKGSSIANLNKFTDLASGPCLSLDLTKSGPECAHEGDIITYTYAVHNDGDVPLENVSVTDSLGITVTGVDESPADGFNDGDANTNGLLDPCETWQFTADYEVLTPQLPDVQNEATATAEYYGSEVSDTDTWSVDILHPDIDLTKEGPPGIGYFESLDADYTYEVENKGDCPLDLSLVDDNVDSLMPVMGDVPFEAFNAGDTTHDGVFDPGEIWEFEGEWYLECLGYHTEWFTNIATATGIDELGGPDGTVTSTDCWSVIIFQWQPRTIGYWGNWDNHYTPTQFDEILEEALDNSTNLADVANGADDDYGNADDWYGEGNVHDFLLGKPPKFKGNPVGKAEFLMEKQYLAAWLNVKAYNDWAGIEMVGDEPDDFIGTADVGMDPNATVYLSGDAATLFGATTTVMDILNYINDDKESWTEPDNFKAAQELLDAMNNAENNGYEMFIYPEFAPGVCPVELRDNPPVWDVPLPTEDVAGSVVMAGNDELEVFVYLDAGNIDTDYLVFLESYPGPVPTGVNMPQWTIIGTLTTDSHGHGTFYTSVSDLANPPTPITPGVYYFQIVLGNWGVFGTDVATITIT